MPEFNRASAQAFQENNDLSSQGNYYLSSNQDDIHYGQQSAQWNATPSVYANHDATPTYQSTESNLQSITTTESMGQDTQYYSSYSGILTPVPSPHSDLGNDCMNVPMGSDFSACQVMPSTVAEAPMALPSAQHFPLASDYSVNDYTHYSQSAAQENSLSLLSTQELDNELRLPSGRWSANSLYNEDIYAMIEGSSSSVSSIVPVSPVSMDGSSYSPPVYASLPAPMMAMRRPSYPISEDYADESAHIYQDMRESFYSAPYVDESQNDRTIKASRPHQRPLLSAAMAKAPVHEDDDSSPPSSPEARSNDDRSDPHYKAKPGSDGLYHCPYAGQQDCEHKPTQQKCAYDKYLDSHLKPYRCKAKNAPQCAEARFSSTACRLRHEREAHGLHGHGKMPHLCHFDGCDRAAPDNGFPRRWNLFDHMKRVHAWSPPESECDIQPDDDSPPASLPRVEKKLATEKRKKVTKPSSQPMKRGRSGISAQSNQAALKLQQNNELLLLKQKWTNCFARMQTQQQCLQPGDAMGFEKLNAAQNELYTIDIQFRRAQAGQAAAGISGYA